MGARIFTNPNMSINTDSAFSIDKIGNFLQGMAANKRADSLLLLQQAKWQYEKDTKDKLQRSVTRLSDIGSGFDWDSTLKNPSDMFSAPLPDMKAAFDKYSEGQLADGQGVSAGAFQNMYNASAIRNLNLQIGSYNALKATTEAENPGWSDSDVNDYMAKTYGADNLYTKTLQIGGGNPMAPASAVDPSTGQQVQLMGLEYTPAVRERGIGERLMGAFKDPYTGDWNWKSSLIGPGGIAAYGLHKYQAGKGATEIAKHAQHVKDGGLNKSDWTKKYGKATKKSILADAKNIASKKTTPAKYAGKAKKFGKKFLPYGVGMEIGGKAGEMLGGEGGDLVGRGVGALSTWKVMKKLKDPAVLKKLYKVAGGNKKVAKIMTKLGLSAAGYLGPQAAEPISTALGMAGTAWAAYDIMELVNAVPELHSILSGE